MCVSFKIMNNQSIVSEINGALCVAAKRQIGLIKLSKYLERNIYNVDDECCSYWLKNLLQICDNHATLLHAKLSHYCLYLLLLNCNSNAQLTKLIQQQFLDKLVNTLLTPLDILTQNSLVCLHELMRSFRGTLSPFKSKIELYLIEKMSSNSNTIVKWSCKCYAKLVYLYKNINQFNQDTWNVYFNNILSSTHQLLNMLFDQDYAFDSHVPIPNDSNQQQTLIKNIFNINTSRDLKENSNFDEFYGTLLKKYEACCLTLSYMMNDVDNVFAKIRIQLVFKLIQRVFNFDVKKILKNNFINIEQKSLLMILHDVYRLTMSLAQEFFKCFKSDLILISDDINKLFTQYSLVSKSEHLGLSLPIFYDTIREWCDSVGVNCAFNKYLSCVLENILENLKPFKNKFEANLKKDFKNNHKSIRFESVLIDPQSNKLALSSLKCLKSLIRTFGIEFSYDEFSKIQSSIISNLINIQHSYSNKIPYNDDACRHGLYETLSELCLTNNMKIQPPLSVAMSIFTQAKDHDSSHIIRLFAQTTLNALRAFICPILPIYYHEYEDHTQKQHDQTQFNGFNLQQPLFQPQTTSDNSQAQLPLSNGFHINNEEMIHNDEQESSSTSSPSPPSIQTNTYNNSNNKRRLDEITKQTNNKKAKSSDQEEFEVLDSSEDDDEIENGYEQNEEEEAMEEDKEDDEIGDEEEYEEEDDDLESEFDNECDDDNDDMVDEDDDIIEPVSKTLYVEHEIVDSNTGEATEAKLILNKTEETPIHDQTFNKSEVSFKEEAEKEILSKSEEITVNESDSKIDGLVDYDVSDEIKEELRSDATIGAASKKSNETSSFTTTTFNGHTNQNGIDTFNDVKENIEATLSDGKKEREFQSFDKTLKEMMNSLNVDANPN